MHLIDSLLCRHGHFFSGRSAGSCLPVSPQPTSRDVRLVATATHEWPFIRMKSLMQLQMHVLSESIGALVAAVGFLSRVQSHVCLQVGGGAESFTALVTRMGFLSSVHQIVLLQVGQLGEGLGA